MTKEHKIALVQWPDGLQPDDAEWQIRAQQIAVLAPDVLVTNEMPFGPWLAAQEVFDDVAADASVAIHEMGLRALERLGVPLVLSSRPVRAVRRLANEAFALENGHYVPLHQKHFFPAEPGWYETTWFETVHGGFKAIKVSGLKIGVLLCTELMFNEHARAYGRAGVELIVAPRATGVSVEEWQTAGAMAALVSGSFVVTPNRVGRVANGPMFGGVSMAFAPGGRLLAKTSKRKPSAVVTIDVTEAQRQKLRYPCYVSENTCTMFMQSTALSAKTRRP